MSEIQDLYLGKKQYSVLALPNMAHAKIVRSPHAHARITKIDTSEALKLPGVLAVVTHAAFPKLQAKFAMMGEAGAVNLQHLSANCLAHDKVLYKGHAVAAVAATNVHAAEEAAKKIEKQFR